MKRVICLYRVSTVGQVDHDDIPMQRIECRKFAEQNGWTIIKELQEKGVWTAAAALEGEDAFTADLSGPLCLVIGSEGDGISRLTLEKCDRRLTLPMKGHIDSLNASVAAGILLFQAMRARLP